MSGAGLLVVGALAAGLLVWGRRRAQSRGDGEWGVRVSCAQCKKEVPRWYLLDRGTPRGPYSRYQYPIPTACRACRHQRGIAPLPWEPGESEAQYSARSEKHVAAAVSRMR